MKISAFVSFRRPVGTACLFFLVLAGYGQSPDFRSMTPEQRQAYFQKINAASYQDRKKMLEQLGITLPQLPPDSPDPARSPLIFRHPGTLDRYAGRIPGLRGSRTGIPPAGQKGLRHNRNATARHYTRRRRTGLPAAYRGTRGPSQLAGFPAVGTALFWKGGGTVMQPGPFCSAFTPKTSFIRHEKT